MMHTKKFCNRDWILSQFLQWYFNYWIIWEQSSLWKELAYTLKEMLHLWCQVRKKHQQLTQKETSARAVFPSPKWGSLGQTKAKSWSLWFAFFKVSPFCFLHPCPFKYFPTSDSHYFPLVKAEKNCMSCRLDYILGLPGGTSGKEPTCQWRLT